MDSANRCFSMILHIKVVHLFACLLACFYPTQEKCEMLLSLGVGRPGHKSNIEMENQQCSN